MYRMILVDDEPQIRRGLEGLIPWEDYGIELVGEADNGVSAKILIERVCPDRRHPNAADGRPAASRTSKRTYKLS